MREIVHIQAGQCGNQIGAKVCKQYNFFFIFFLHLYEHNCRVQSPKWRHFCTSAHVAKIIEAAAGIFTHTHSRLCIYPILSELAICRASVCVFPISTI